MEWVVTTGRTVAEALDAALDELGVDDDDAEYEVVAEPRRGIFGIGAAPATVRARVRPAVPPAKQDRRDRRRRADRRRADRDAEGQSTERAPSRAVRAPAPAVRPPGTHAAAPPPPPAGDRLDTVRQDDRPAADHPNGDPPGPGGAMTDELTIEEQATLAHEFVEDVVDAFGYEAEVASRVGDEDIDVAVTGDDLGLLIGPKGQTLQALQELARTVVQRHTTARTARLHVDVAGYREKRRAALERFVHQVAGEVLATGERRALEPMTPADRKIVHDTVNDIDGVRSLSEGEDDRRRVVLVPADAGSDADG